MLVKNNENCKFDLSSIKIIENDIELQTQNNFLLTVYLNKLLVEGKNLYLVNKKNNEVTNYFLELKQDADTFDFYVISRLKSKDDILKN